MSTTASRGTVPPYQVRGEVTTEIFAYAQQLFFNEYPLVTRLSRSPVGANAFDMVSRSNRNKATTLGAAISSTSATTITLAAGATTTILIGDVLELVSGERVEVTAISGNDLTVIRGAEGTTAATQADASAVRVLYNSRTGAEVNQDGFRTARTIITQNVQTFQVPVSVGGRANAIRNLVLPERDTLLAQEELEAGEELLRDAEQAVLYGIGSGIAAAGSRPRMTGMNELARLTGGRVTSPTNASTYKPVDFVRDTVEALANRGGTGDTMIVSPNFVSAFALWGYHFHRIPAGSNVFGTPIDVFEAPFVQGVTMIIDRGLRPFTACLFDSRRVRMRYMRDMFVKPRGSRGDAIESDIIADWALEVEDPARSLQWLQGVTTFAAP